jgi:excisionase family DNA binding protein
MSNSTMAPNCSLTVRQAAAYLGLSHWTLTAWRKQGRGPRYVRLGRRVAYRIRDLDVFLNACTVEVETTQPGQLAGTP